MTADPKPAHRQGGTPVDAPFGDRYQLVPSAPLQVHPVFRVLIFIAVFVFFLGVIQIGLLLIPQTRGLGQAQSTGVITPERQIFLEAMQVLPLIAAAIVMAIIEKRTFADFGWPMREAFGKRFWQGLPYGFAMVSLLLASISALHGFSLGSFALSRAEAVKDGALYGFGFLLVGVFEEFSFRGYMQSTLALATGFWPTAVALSILFGVIHLLNPGEKLFGAVMVTSFGLVAALSLKRTGSIWFAIGMHAAFDWGETFFYSVPDSGLVAQGHLLNSTLKGPAWLTGGTVGPEGSVFAFVVLAVAAAGIHFLFPAQRSESKLLLSEQS